MLFLFVLMLVGVDASDSVVETITRPAGAGDRRRPAARRWSSCSASARSRSAPVGRPRRGQRATATSRRLADMLFSRYVFAFEVTSALLITAALGAMVLAHRERLEPKPTQARPGRAADARLRRRRRAPRPAAGARRLRPAQRGRHPGAAARRHRRPSCRSPGCSPPAARCRRPRRSTRRAPTAPDRARPCTRGGATR